MANTNTLLTRREVAELLRLSSRSIPNYERRGALNPVRISSRAVRYRLADVEKLIGSKIPPTPLKEEKAS